MLTSDDGADDRMTRLVEALATVLGRRLDAIDARLDAMAPVAAPQDATDVSARLDLLDQRLEELVTAAVRGAEAAGTSPSGADAALRHVLARLDAIEGRLTASPAGAPSSGGPPGAMGAEEALARVETRLDQLNRLLLG